MDKKNTLLLTVIAIATLLVAVVGATFAYFTAQNGNAATADINVKTSTTNSATITAFKPININANQFNFANLEGDGDTTNVGSQMGETSGSIAFTASDAATATEKYCYKVDLKITTNTFTNTLPDQVPELVFSISKAAKKETQPSDGDYVEIASSETISDLTYNASVLENTRVCQNDATQNSDTYHVVPESCKDNQTIKGWDITTKTGPSYAIPRLSSGDTDNTNSNVHEIDAAAGKTVTDYWKASVTFVNYSDSDIGEEQVANQNGNADKSLSAQLVFTPVDCTNGTPLNAE